MNTSNQMVIISNAAQLASLAANSEAVIYSTIDLGGNLIEIAAGCSLHFEGGRLNNGTLKGNNTSFYGDVKVLHLAGSFATPVRASFLTTSRDMSQLKELLELNVTTVILDADYTLARTSVCSICSCYVKDIIGEDITISVEVQEEGVVSITPVCLIVAYQLKYICGITFNGGNNSFSGFLKIQNGAQDSITVENVKVNNIKNTINESNVKGIYIDKYSTLDLPFIVRDCRIIVRNVYMNTLYQRGDNSITEGAGSVTALQIFVDAGSQVSIKVENCSFNEIHCIDQYENTIYEDAAGVFVQSEFMEGYTGEANTSVKISNIRGHNFGKRLVKTDCANVSVRNVFGTNEVSDFLCLVGLNNSFGKFSYASIKNIHYEGIVGYSSSNGSFTFETAIRHTTAENIVSKVTAITPRTPSDQETGTNYPTFYPASILADDVTVRDLHMIGAQTVHLPAKENIRFEDVTYDDTVGAINSYSEGIFMPMLGASAVINGLKVKAHHKRRLIACNYRDANSTSSDIFINDADLEFAATPSGSTYKTILIEGQDWESGNNGHRLNLTMKNCICRHAENFHRFPLRKYIGQWTLENIKFVYDVFPTSDDFKYGGNFMVYNDIDDSLTLKDFTVICHNVPSGILPNKPMIHLETYEPGTVATKVHLSNIRSNCAKYEIYTDNVCWDEYIDATVNRYHCPNFGTAQKGFMVKDYSTGVKYVWSGTAWVTPTV